MKRSKDKVVFWLCRAACSTRDWTWALGSESAEPWPLDRQGIPRINLFLMKVISTVPGNMLWLLPLQNLGSRQVNCSSPTVPYFTGSWYIVLFRPSAPCRFLVGRPVIDLWLFGDLSNPTAYFPGEENFIDGVPLGPGGCGYRLAGSALLWIVLTRSTTMFEY